jgi:hypothetical protein
MDALIWLNRGRFSVYQWRKIISGVLPKKFEKLEIDVTNFISNTAGQKDFIHNLRIMDTLYTDTVVESSFLADFSDDDYYARRTFSLY